MQATLTFTGTFGSSEIATICGLNPYKTPRELYYEKLGIIERFEGNDATELGQHMEPYIAQLWSRRAGRIVIHNDTGKFYNTKYPLAHATPDYFVDHYPGLHDTKPEILECKHSGHTQLKYWLDDNTPDYAHCQLMWQMGVCGIKIGHVAGLVGGSVQNFFMRTFEFDQGIFDAMYQRALEFADRLDRQDPPPADGDDLKTMDHLLSNGHSDTELILPASCHELINSHQDLLRVKCEIQKELDGVTEGLKGLQARIRAEMHDKLVARVGDYEVRLKEVKRKAYSVKESSYWNFKIRNLAEKEGVKSDE